MNSYGLNNAYILTENDEEEIKIENKEINVIPVWKWLLKN